MHANLYKEANFARKHLVFSEAVAWACSHVGSVTATWVKDPLLLP